jgi:hypothetical protein
MEATGGQRRDCPPPGEIGNSLNEASGRRGGDWLAGQVPAIWLRQGRRGALAYHV